MKPKPKRNQLGFDTKRNSNPETHNPTRFMRSWRNILTQTVIDSDLGSRSTMFLANNDDPMNDDRGELNKGDNDHRKEKRREIHSADNHYCQNPPA